VAMMAPARRGTMRFLTITTSRVRAQRGALGPLGKFTGPDVLKAIQGHVLAKGEVVGVYALNPTWQKRSV